MYKNILMKVQWTDTFMCSGGCRKCGDDLIAQCNEPRTPRLCCDSTCSYYLWLISGLVVVGKERCFALLGLGWLKFCWCSEVKLLEWSSSWAALESYPINLCCYFAHWVISEAAQSWWHLQRKLQHKIPTQPWKVLDIKFLRPISNCYN